MIVMMIPFSQNRLEVAFFVPTIVVLPPIEIHSFLVQVFPIPPASFWTMMMTMMMIMMKTIIIVVISGSYVEQNNKYDTRTDHLVEEEVIDHRGRIDFSGLSSKTK